MNPTIRRRTNGINPARYLRTQPPTSRRGFHAYLIAQSKEEDTAPTMRRTLLDLARQVRTTSYNASRAPWLAIPA